MDKIVNDLKKTDKSPAYYAYYPRLFYKYFDEIDVDVVNELSDAGYCYYQSVLMIDYIIDNKCFENISLISILQEKTVKMLTAIFGINSDFWKYWDTRKREFMDAVTIERKLQFQEEVEWNIYMDLADKKSAIGKIAIDSLYQLSKNRNKELYWLLLQSHYYFSVGFQLYDDVKDFKEDFQTGQFNWAIYELKKRIDFNQYQNDIHVLHKYLFIKGIAGDILTKSIEAFQKAIDFIMPLNTGSEWLDTIKGMKETIQNYLDTTISYMKVLEKKIEIAKDNYSRETFFDIESIMDLPIKRGLNYIKQDYLKNYAELKHIMYLSRLDDFENDGQIHVSDTFQRAMLNDCMETLSSRLKVDILKYMRSEIDYLMERINKDNVGGWSYFPTVNEIAADIDDLGQIMQLLIKTGNRELIDEYCLTPIHIALSNKYNTDGGIATWIIPNNNKTQQQEKQDLFNRTKWGVGPDVEVVANFVYALYLYDSEKYKDMIEKSFGFICKNQHEIGFWESRWYYGMYYGTYVCLRLLKIVESKYSSRIQKAIEFIMDSQNADGGFGLKENVSDALSTSLALLALKMFLNDKQETILKAQKYLFDNQLEDGSWQDVDFIKPKTNEPYKSKVLTTAFVLKSIV